MVSLLSNILDSKQPAELLAFLSVAPARSFSAKELAVRLKTTTIKIQSAARSLERQNLVRIFLKNHMMFIMLNSRHPQVPALQEHLLNEQGAWHDELISSLKKLGDLTGAFLSGFFVGRPELIVDLLLVGKVSSNKLEQFLNSAQKSIGQEINYSTMSKEEFLLRRDTFDKFIKDIFDYPHLVLFDKTKEPAKVVREPLVQGGFNSKKVKKAPLVKFKSQEAINQKKHVVSKKRLVKQKNLSSVVKTKKTPAKKHK